MVSVGQHSSDQASAGNIRLEQVPLTEAIGAEIRGVSISQPFDEAVIDALRQAWLDHCVLLLREQSLSDTDLVALTRHFGDLEMPPPADDGAPYLAEHPEVMVLSNVVDGGRTIGSLGNAEAVWHSDLNFTDEPPAASMLYAHEVPPTGGNTGFASMYRAYQTLPADLAGRIEGHKIRHDARFNSAGQPRREQRPPVDHPIVRTHPETGRKCLYLGRRTNAAIVDLPAAESEALLDALWAHAVHDRFVWYHRWRPGDLVIWDNRCTLHRRDAFDAGHRRIMHRTQTLGTRPY